MRRRCEFCIGEAAADNTAHDAEAGDVEDEVGMEEEEDGDVGKSPCCNEPSGLRRAGSERGVHSFDCGFIGSSGCNGNWKDSSAVEAGIAYKDIH